MKLPRNHVIGAVAFVTFGSGLLNIISVIGKGLAGRLDILADFFPLEFIHLSRSLTLLLGFALIVVAVNIYKRKRRAWLFTMGLSAFSAVFHMTKGLDYEEASVSLALCIVLLIFRDRFTVKSTLPSLRLGLVRFTAALLIAFGYGTAGFWFLERREFGYDFNWSDAIVETVRYLAFIGDPLLVAQTHHAAWFEDSLYLISATAILYAFWSIFRPAYYRLRTRPLERLQAKALIEKHGRSSLDFFKYWPDKSFFFSSSRNAVIAYGVSNAFALALADPVGPEEEIETIIREFMEFCRENDWNPGFHQTLPDFLPIYAKLGFHKIKVGDDAITDLAAFSLDGRANKEKRHTLNHIESLGVKYVRYEPPLADEILSRMSAVSDDWLSLAGRRERRFTLGIFDIDYLRRMPVSAAIDANGVMLGFINEMPSCCKGEATIDLMRRRTEAPEGTMDYLFIKLILHLKQQGYARFNLGMAPMSGFAEEENATREERAIHYFFQHLNFLFNYQGLRHFKSKYATFWEPRYSICRTSLDLPQLVLALRRLSEIKSGNQP